MKTALVLTVAMLAQAIGNVYLSQGMKLIAAVNHLASDEIVPLGLQVISSPTIWMGTGFSLVFLVLFAASLSWADLSLVLPASSFGYVLNVAFAHHFLREPVSVTRWIGTLLISGGVILVSRSSAKGSPADSGVNATVMDGTPSRADL
jgi:uncharacterized membrane protein